MCTDPSWQTLVVAFILVVPQRDIEDNKVCRPCNANTGKAVSLEANRDNVNGPVYFLKWIAPGRAFKPDLETRPWQSLTTTPWLDVEDTCDPVYLSGREGKSTDDKKNIRCGGKAKTRMLQTRAPIGNLENYCCSCVCRLISKARSAPEPGSEDLSSVEVAIAEEQFPVQRGGNESGSPQGTCTPLFGIASFCTESLRRPMKP